MSSTTTHDDLAIVAIGMATPLGITASGACAAARAGIMRISPLPEFEVYDEENVESVPAAAHVAMNYTDGFTGLGRLARLGQLALKDLEASPGWEPHEPIPTGFLVSVSDGYVERSYMDRCGEHGPGPVDQHTEAWLEALDEHLLPSLTSVTKTLLEPESIRLRPEGATGFVESLREADRLLATGTIGRCVIGAVDSRSDPAFIPALIGLDLLKTPSAPSRAIPGEAAAFLVVEHGSTAAERGHTVLATIPSSAMTDDECDLLGEQISDGQSLASAITECREMATSKQARVGFLIGDIDGNERRSQDLGQAIARLPDEIRNAPLWTIGEGFGSVGAAAPVVAICLAVRAFVRGYAPAPAAIAFSSADSGARVAICIAPDRRDVTGTSDLGMG